MSLHSNRDIETRQKVTLWILMAYISQAIWSVKYRPSKLKRSLFNSDGLYYDNNGIFNFSAARNILKLKIKWLVMKLFMKTFKVYTTKFTNLWCKVHAPSGVYKSWYFLHPIHSSFYRSNYWSVIFSPTVPIWSIVLLIFLSFTYYFGTYLDLASLLLSWKRRGGSSWSNDVISCLINS